MLLAGPVGNIELVLTVPSECRSGSMAVVCHPHPLHGGTMDNKVVATLVRVYRDHGIPVLRFNFRGVGASEGLHDQARGEVDDLMSVIRFGQQELVAEELWLAGFSFGSYVAAEGARRVSALQGISLRQLVLVAPPVHHYPYDGLVLPEGTVVVQGDEDEVVPAGQVLDWVHGLVPVPTLLEFPGCGHFFHGRLTELKARLGELLR